jgi:hypothetical protein
MKTLLTILSTLSLASPIISVSAGVFSDVNSISATDEQKKDSIPDLADVDGDGTATNIANPVKMLKTDLDPESSLRTNAGDDFYMYTTKNYSIDSKFRDDLYIDTEGNSLGFDKVDLQQPSMYQFNIAGKTIMGASNGALTWAGTNEQNQLVLRDLGVVPNTTARGGAKTAVPFSYMKNGTSYGFAMTVNGTNGSKETYDKLAWIDVTSNNGNNISSGKLNFPTGNVTISDINDAVGGENKFDSIYSIAAIRDLKNEDELFANKIVLGLAKTGEGANIYYEVFNVDYVEKTIKLTKPDNSSALKVTVANVTDAGSTPQVYAILKNGDMLMKAGSGNDATYFLASELLKPDEVNIARGENIVNALEEASNAKGLYNENFVLSNIEWTPGDNKLIVDSYDAGSKKTKVTSEAAQHYIFTIDVVGDADGNLTFSNAKWLFTTLGGEELDARTLPNTLDQLQTGQMVNEETNQVEYNYILFTAGQYKTYIYKYNYSNGKSNIGQQVSYDVNADIAKSPILEVLTQSNYSYDKTMADRKARNNLSQIQTTVIIGNRFHSINRIEPSGVPYSMTSIVISPKFDVTTVELPDIQMVSAVFTNVDIAFSDFKRNDNQLRRAYLEALIQGKFEYRKSMVNINPQDPKDAEGNGWYQENENIKHNSLYGRLIASGGSAETAFAASLDDITYKIDGQIIPDLDGNKNEDAGIIISTTSETLNRLLNYNASGEFDVFDTIEISGSGVNSVVKGSKAIRVTSQNKTILDVNDINRDVNDAIKKDTNNTFELHFDSPSEATGYIINRINDVIYAEGRKYLNDNAIPLMFRDYNLNNAVYYDGTDLPKTLWTTYNGFEKQEKTIYTSKFDGTRPFVMQEKSVNEITNSTGIPWSEAGMRDRMGWGFQSFGTIQELQNHKDENGNVTINLTNIMLELGASQKLSFLRGDSSNFATGSEANQGGILNYNSITDIDSRNTLLNIGKKNDDGTDGYTNLKVVLPESSLEPFYQQTNGSYNLDAGAAADLDKAAGILKNQVIDGTHATDKTSFFTYFERMKKAFNLDDSIQFSVYKDAYDNMNYWLPTGDNYVDILIYDAIYFQNMNKITSASDVANSDTEINPDGSASTTGLYNSGHYRLVRVYLSNVNNETANTSWIIYGGFFGGIFVTAFFAYTIFVTIRKSFYKRGTTREAAKNAARLHALEKQERKLRKKNHEPEPPVDDLTDAEDLG